MLESPDPPLDWPDWLGVLSEPAAAAEEAACGGFGPLVGFDTSPASVGCFFEDILDSSKSLESLIVVTRR